MGKIVSISALLGGAIVVLMGLNDILQHVIAGDLFTQTCNDSNVCQTQLMVALAKLMAGVAVFSPGVAVLKVGPFARAKGTEGGPAA